MDAWEFADSVDILSKLPANFYSELEATKKWTERRDALEALLKLVGEGTRLDAKGNYNELIDTLRRVLEKDSNINCSSNAAK